MKILVLAAVSLLAAGAAAAADDEFEFGETPLPRAVLAQTGCADTVQPYPSRRAFDGGFVFAARCPGDKASFVEVLVWAADEAGKDARLLLSSEVVDIANGALPGTVAAVSECNDPPDSRSTRRTFAGGVVFAVRCPGNNANSVEELIWARDADGTEARVLVFPSPDTRYGGDPATTLSNIRWHAERDEVKEVAVDQEEDICRSEGIWRLQATPPEAENVYWRQTGDCEGKGGWEVLIDRREKAGK